MDVVVTGAFGKVGTAILDHLSEDPAYEFTNVDVVDHAEYDGITADVTDYDAIRPVFEGRDAVVHLAIAEGLTWSVTDVSWAAPLRNDLAGTTTVLDAALDAGVETFVYASSNHVVGTYERELAPDIYEPDFDLTIDHRTPIRPDSVYGASKAFGEALARFSAEYHGMRCYALRLGSVYPAEHDHPYYYPELHVDRGDFERDSPEYQERVVRAKALWQSRRDLAQLVDRCLRDETVTFDVFYGFSDNERRWFDLDHAREVLGYEPRDSADDWDGPPEA